MACITLETIEKSCDNNSGGIYRFFVTEQDNIASISTDETGTNWQVDGITLANPLMPFIELEFKRNTSSYTEESAIDLINGSSYVTQTINLMFHRRQQEKSRAIQILAGGQRYLTGLLLDANGIWWYFPFLQLSATGEGSGTARADGSKYSVTLIAENETLAYVVDEAILGPITDPPVPVPAP
jgi:hypothetical protein